MYLPTQISQLHFRCSFTKRFHPHSFRLFVSNHLLNCRQIVESIGKAMSNRSLVYTHLDDTVLANSRYNLTILLPHDWTGFLFDVLENLYDIGKVRWPTFTVISYRFTVTYYIS